MLCHSLSVINTTQPDEQFQKHVLFLIVSIAVYIYFNYGYIYFNYVYIIHTACPTKIYVSAIIKCVAYVIILRTNDSKIKKIILPPWNTFQLLAKRISRIRVHRLTYTQMFAVVFTRKHRRLAAECSRGCVRVCAGVCACACAFGVSTPQCIGMYSSRSSRTPWTLYRVSILRLRTVRVLLASGQMHSYRGNAVTDSITVML